MNVLGEIGGRNIDECVKRIMKFIISDTLATNLNMSGRNNKKGFGPTNLFEIVYSKYFFFTFLYLSLKPTLTHRSINCDLIKQKKSKDSFFDGRAASSLWIP